MRQLRGGLLVGAAGVLGAVAVLAVAQPALRAANAPARAAALDDPTIVAIFDAANTWDIETGELGVRKGATKEIRDFGRQLVRDHRAVRQQGRDLAHKLGVTPTPPADFALAKDHAAAMKRLEATHGAAFDRAFLENEIAFHKAVIDAMTQTLLPATQNAELKALELRVAPAFQAHLQMAEHLLEKTAS